MIPFKLVMGGVAWYSKKQKFKTGKRKQLATYLYPVIISNLQQTKKAVYILQHLVEYYFRLTLQPCIPHPPYLILCPVEEEVYACLNSVFIGSEDTLLKKALGTEATFPLP